MGMTTGYVIIFFTSPVFSVSPGGGISIFGRRQTNSNIDLYNVHIIGMNITHVVLRYVVKKITPTGAFPGVGQFFFFSEDPQLHIYAFNDIMGMNIGYVFKIPQFFYSPRGVKIFLIADKQTPILII